MRFVLLFLLVFCLNYIVSSLIQGFNGRLAFAIAASVLGSSFQHGYNTGVVNNAEQIIRDWLSIVISNRTQEVVEKDTITIVWSVCVSIFCIGGMIGGVMTGELDVI